MILDSFVSFAIPANCFFLSESDSNLREGHAVALIQDNRKAVMQSIIVS